MATLGITIPTCKRCTSHAGTIVHVAIDGEYAGHIVISDQLKADAVKAIESLKQLGVSKTVMLSGDKREVVEQVAEQTKVTEYHAELLPTDKVKHVERLIAEKNADETIASLVMESMMHQCWHVLMWALLWVLWEVMQLSRQPMSY